MEYSLVSLGREYLDQLSNCYLSYKKSASWHVMFVSSKEYRDVYHATRFQLQAKSIINDSVYVNCVGYNCIVFEETLESVRHLSEKS
jgi:hypothetical protein